MMKWLSFSFLIDWCLPFIRMTLNNIYRHLSRFMINKIKELIWLKAWFHLMVHLKTWFLLNIYWNWYIFDLLFLFLVMTSASTITCYNYYVFLMLLATFDNNTTTTTGMTSCLIKELFPNIIIIHIQQFF
jgi:hypothetical protein